jgi:hypothetical protein
MAKKIKANYTFKVYKKATNTYLATHTITANDSEAATDQLKYKYWVKFGKPVQEYDVINVELISSTKLHKWCLFYITEEKKSVVEHHLYTKAFSLKKAKKHFKSIIEKIPKDSGYFLYASQELKKSK